MKSILLLRPTCISKCSCSPSGNLGKPNGLRHPNISVSPTGLTNGFPRNPKEEVAYYDRIPFSLTYRILPCSPKTASALGKGGRLVESISSLANYSPIILYTTSFWKVPYLESLFCLPVCFPKSPVDLTRNNPTVINPCNNKRMECKAERHHFFLTRIKLEYLALFKTNNHNGTMNACALLQSLVWVDDQHVTRIPGMLTLLKCIS